MTRVTDLTFITATRQAIEKPDTDKKTISGGRPDIDLENPFSSKDSLRYSGGNQQLLNKDSSSGNTMR